MYCDNCGNANRAGARFCRVCGKSLEASMPPPPAQSSPPATPPSAIQTPPVSAAPKKASGGGCGKMIGCSCLALIVLLVLIGGGGFLAYTQGWLTLTTLLNLAGMGPGAIEVNNFRDDAIQVTITRVDGARDSSPSPTTLRLNAFDVQSYRAPEPGKYRVEFRAARGNDNFGACALTVRSGDKYQFVVLPERIAIHRANNPATSGRDLIIQTSVLCR